MLAILLTALTLHGSPALAGTLYHYKDKNGTMHIVDSEAQIPEEYRDQLKKLVTQAPEGASQNKAQADEEDEEEAPKKSGKSGWKKHGH
jgi:hypothetical protein